MRYHSYLFILLLLFLPTALPSVPFEYRWSACNKASTYTQGSPYSSNLDLLITDLVRNTPQSSGFNTSTRGQSPNQVYGLLQCIGNISPENCSACSREANKSLHLYCANKIGGRVWMNYCFLRYDNTNFSSTLDSDAQVLLNEKDVTENTDTFVSTTSSLLSNLSDEAYNPANKLGAVGTAAYSTSKQIYGLVQCWRDLSINNCRTCLTTAKKAVQDCCSSKQGAQPLSGSCTLRYEIYPFFELSSPPPTTSTPETVIRFSNKDVPSNMLQAYEYATASLLSNLSNKVYNDPAKNGIARGSAYYNFSDKVYGLVKCGRDLLLQECRKCLSTAREQLENCCSSKEAAQNTYGNCTVKYYISEFSDSSESPPFSDVSSPSPTSTPSPPLAQSPANATYHRKTNIILIILAVVGGMMLALVLCMIGIRKSVKSTIFGRPVTVITRNEEGHEYSPESGLLLLEEKHLIFRLEALEEATEHFHDNNKLGEGGFGTVYKGITRDGKEIAVKKLSARSTQGKREFMNEVKLVANIQHRNLVKLVGCCGEGGERLLVYEYLPNKSLDAFLFDPEKRILLDWQKRRNIIIGIVRGLLYLHEDSKLRIIHRDIKASNILLDERLNPKIADFGLARLFTDNETQIQSKIAGTYGYMAPEYAMRGQLSVKADVYSFGVLLLEIVSGRKNTDINFRGEKQSLSVLEWAWRLFQEGHVLNIVDTLLMGNCREEQVIRCIHIGLLCTQAEADIRPLISTIATMISTDAVPLPNPTRPAFVSMTSESPNISFPPIVYSRNEITISNMEPR